jgi:hypothetical protein
MYGSFALYWSHTVASPVAWICVLCVVYVWLSCCLLVSEYSWSCRLDMRTVLQPHMLTCSSILFEPTFLVVNQ